MSRSAIISIIAIVLIVIFAIQNAAVAPLTVFFWKFNMSLALLLLFVFILGAASGYFFRVALNLRRRKGVK